MINEESFDTYFSDKLAQHSDQAPMYLWKGVANGYAQLLRRKRRRKALIWSLAALFSLLLLLLFLTAPTDPSVDSFPIAPQQRPLASTAPNSSAYTAEPQDGFNSQRFTAKPVRTNTTVGSAQRAPVAVLNAQQAPPPVVISSQQTSPSSSLPHIVMERPGIAPLPLRQEQLPMPAVREQLSVPSSNKMPWDVTIDLMVSPDFAIQKLSARDEAFEPYAELRRNTESYRYGFSAQLRFSTISPGGFAVRSGLNFSQFNEQLNYLIEEQEALTITNEYDLDGNIIRTDTTVEFSVRQQVVNNQFTTIDIPILLGYEINRDKRLSFSINTGAYLNMVFDQEGAFADPAQDGVVFFSSKEDDSYRAFRNRLGLSLYGSVGLHFRLHNGMRLILEPNLRWTPAPITDPGYVLEQRYISSGLFVGLRRRL